RHRELSPEQVGAPRPHDSLGHPLRRRNRGERVRSGLGEDGPRRPERARKPRRVGRGSARRGDDAFLGDGQVLEGRQGDPILGGMRPLTSRACRREPSGLASLAHREGRSASVAISLDGVLAPIDGANRPTEGRAEEAADGEISKGPAGYREASCATLSFCDEKGDLIGAIRLARAPETKKATLKRMLTEEVSAALRLQPTLKVVKVADGAADNWDYLSSDALPPGVQVVDFFHASEHLHAAIANVYGDGTRETRHRHEVLRDELDGAEKVIRALKPLATKHPRKEVVTRELGYFRKHKKRMNYAELKAQGFMIGSGVVEAACKTLVTQRLKQSGMRWSVSGAQAILTPRGWDQSERFDKAWALAAATFKADVTVLANVIALKPQSAPPKPRVKA